jgi:PKD repeat protein
MSTEQNPTHTFEVGVYDISLQVKNAAGVDTDTKLGDINVPA